MTLSLKELEKQVESMRNRVEALQAKKSQHEKAIAGIDREITSLIGGSANGTPKKRAKKAVKRKVAKKAKKIPAKAARKGSESDAPKRKSTRRIITVTGDLAEISPFRTRTIRVLGELPDSKPGKTRIIKVSGDLATKLYPLFKTVNLAEENT